MTDQPVTNIVDLANQFRKALQQRDNKALSQIIKAYGDIYTRLQDKIKVLTLEMANMETITAASVRKLASYKSLIKEIEIQLRDFQGFAKTTMMSSASDAIALGVRDARLLTLAGNPAIAASFKNLNPRAVENLISYFGEGSALMKRLDKLAGTNALNVAQTIIDNVALGNNPKTIAGLIKNSLGGGLTDALRMTRTVQIYSYREANRASYIANSDVVKGWVWMSTLDDVCCMSCVVMHGTMHTNDEVMDDHYNGHCYPKDTLVSGNSIEGFISRYYNGDVITINTSSGQLFTVTPNHPILTDNGWILSQELKSGDNIIRYTGNQRTSTSVDPYKYHRPTLIQNIPSSLGMDWLGRVPRTAKNLYGYRENSNINVIKSNRLLWNNFISSLCQPIAKQYFTGGLFTRGLSAICPKSLFSFSNNSTNTGLLCFNKSLSFDFNRNFSISNNGSIRNITNNNPVLDQSSMNYSTGNVKDFSEFKLRYAGQIQLDKIIGINTNSFHGLVYNLQTKDRWYIANNIITHNCAMLPVTIGSDNPLGSDTAGQDWFKSLDENKQRELMGQGKFEAYKENKFELSQLSTQRQDEVYGTMRVVTPLKDLIGE